MSPKQKLLQQLYVYTHVHAHSYDQHTHVHACTYIYIYMCVLTDEERSPCSMDKAAAWARDNPSLHVVIDTAIYSLKRRTKYRLLFEDGQLLRSEIPLVCNDSKLFARAWTHFEFVAEVN